MDSPFNLQREEKIDFRNLRFYLGSVCERMANESKKEKAFERKLSSLPFSRDFGCGYSFDKQDRETFA
jgi:hypothetical protein